MITPFQWVCVSQKSIRKFQVTPGFELLRPILQKLEDWSVGELKEFLLPDQI
jgi:hypothetical protein